MTGNAAKRWLAGALAKAGLRVVRTRDRYAQDGLFTIHRDRFRGTPAFRAAYARGLQAADGVDPAFEWRIHVALWAARLALRAPGDFVECGVNAGFVSSAIMQHLDWSTLHRRYYLVDTFAGPPLEQYNETEVRRGRRRVAEDAMRAGAYVVDVDRVRRNFAEWPNAVVVQGAVPQALPSIPAREVAFLHLDMNSASPEREALGFFWDRLSRGAIVLLDDYAYHGHEEQAIAIDEVAGERRADVLALPTGQGIIVR
jgi:hypothetical protein